MESSRLSCKWKNAVFWLQKQDVYYYVDDKLLVSSLQSQQVYEWLYGPENSFWKLLRANDGQDEDVEVVDGKIN